MDIKRKFELIENNQDYKRQIDEWTDFVNKKAIHLSCGKPIPIVFWKTFLGLSRTVHIQMYNDSNSRSRFPLFVAKSIFFASMLCEDDFLCAVRLSIKEYEQDKRS
jgi:hypothetical protein